MHISYPLSATGSETLLPIGLSSEAHSLEKLFAVQPTAKYAAGEGIFWEGDAASDIFQLTEGCLRLYRILPDGRRAILGFKFAGEMLGLSCESTYCCTAEAVTPVRLHRLSRARLQAMSETATQLQPLLFRKLFEEIRAAQQHIIVLGQLGAEERTAHFLMSSARRTGADQRRPIIIEMPMTRQDIADHLGLTIETVCRVMSKLKRDGLVALEGRHKVILLRIVDLQQLAGEFDDAEPWGAKGSIWNTTKWPH
ncbi:helix-turn-helix domain-containing protein [Microvirga sp. 17 mud 1-3]|uniref:helix-turn-helix domain-containing protein n=1 Tax=Microvirga sp. 17 mud 1-3 TaxID=2082949 RepID=UPI000D6CD5EB|nr:helix-turn-helix domain-containing protein [Microvirga sp. 17 mud 1-3]AWM88490.1 Crp/Fnr family transcriptional regulator [Microvirga sp. 17 mud 1-3]